MTATEQADRIRARFGHDAGQVIALRAVELAEAIERTAPERKPRLRRQYREVLRVLANLEGQP
ncbi:MAG: hypothetical protein JSS45_06555 [Proteobacteria bacterium]|nr:hypothetical protein [Pseudomonadota bacterium]